MRPTIRGALALSCALSLFACKAPSAAAPTACPSSAQPGNDVVVATYGDGQSITLGELDKRIAKDLYELRSQALESMVLSRLVEAEAKKQNKTEEELLRSIAEKPLPPLPEETLKAMYEQNKASFGDKSFEEMKPQLEAYLQREAKQQAFMTYLTDLKNSAQVKISLPAPRVDVKAVGPSLGAADAPITIVEFSDFQCPYCARAAATVKQVVESNKGKVRLVFRSYPLPFHENAAKASEAALCANEQGKFWQMHDAMFANQQKLDVTSLKASAKELGLDTAAFDACLDSGKFAKQVEEDLKAGQEAGVEGTPAFFVNGRFINGARPAQDFQSIIDAELAAK